MIPSYFILEFANHLNDRCSFFYLPVQELFLFIGDVDLFRLQWQGMTSTVYIINHRRENYGPTFNDCLITRGERRIAKSNVSKGNKVCSRKSVWWLFYLNGKDVVQGQDRTLTYQLDHKVGKEKRKSYIEGGGQESSQVLTIYRNGPC